MINGDVKEFVDGLYYGDERWFTYQGKEYFIQGWVKEGLFYLLLDDAKVEGEDYIWKYSGESNNEAVEEFLAAKLWNGKTFFEVEKEMTWTD